MRIIGRAIAVALRRWGGWVVIADGLVWLAYGLITREYSPRYWSATRFVDHLAVDLYSGGLLLLAVALAAIQARQARSAGRVGWVLLLFGVAGLWARALPAWSGALLLLSLVVGHSLGGLWSDWRGTVGFGLLWLALGVGLILQKPSPPPRVATGEGMPPW